MKITKTISFIVRFVTIGLAIAFLILYFSPRALDKTAPVVEFKESTPAPATGTPSHSYADVVAMATPAVVNISTKTVITERTRPVPNDPVLRRFFGHNSGVPKQRLESSLGSGVIVSAQGYVLTNNHVIQGADEISVALHDGRTIAATVVGSDPESDIAVLKIALDALPVITLGHSTSMRVGDVVLAIGNPFGVGQTVTSGIVSATGRTHLGINTFENYIQTDAAINPGNSGGALINAHGELIGINTAIYSQTGGSQGIGFAIPMQLAKDIMTQIIQHGHVIRGWLGVIIQEIDPQLEASFGLHSLKGALIAQVVKNGPADAAGLLPGDVITAIDGQPAMTTQDTLYRISRIKPGENIALTLIRKGKTKTVKATVAERPVQQ
mgnify:CR=1 FL=1